MKILAKIFVSIVDFLKKPMKAIINVLFVLSILSVLWTTFWVGIHGFDWTRSNIFGFTLTHVQSASMEPEIMTDDRVLTVITSFDKVEVGDVIVYRHTYEDGSTKAIIHRVVEKYDDYLICKGDNNDINDPWKVYPEDIRLKMVSITPF